MKVRVKKNHKGFIYGRYRNEGDEFTLKPVECFEKDEKGNPKIISVDEQFSHVWMEKVKAKPGPKPTSKDDEE